MKALSSRPGRSLRPFGEGSMAAHHGYSLPILLSWLEDMANHETDENVHSHSGPKAQRARKVWDAVEALNEALEMGGES